MNLELKKILEEIDNTSFFKDYKEFKLSKDIDMNQNRIHMSETPVENIFFEEGKAELGEYKIYVNRYTDRLPLNNETPYKIQLIKDGQLIKQKKGSVVNLNEQKYIFSFKIPLE